MGIYLHVVRQRVGPVRGRHQTHAGKVLAFIAHGHAVIFGAGLVFATRAQMLAVAIHSPTAWTVKLLLIDAVGFQNGQKSGIVLHFVAGAFATVDPAGRDQLKLLFLGHYTPLEVLLPG